MVPATLAVESAVQLFVMKMATIRKSERFEKLHEIPRQIPLFLILALNNLRPLGHEAFIENVTRSLNFSVV